jgi:hypothetical protein
MIDWMVTAALQILAAALMYYRGLRDGRKDCADAKPKKYRADVSWPHDRD